VLKLATQPNFKELTAPGALILAQSYLANPGLCISSVVCGVYPFFGAVRVNGVTPRPLSQFLQATFGDESLTNTVSTLCPRYFATTLPRLWLGKDGPRGPDHD